MCLSLCLLLSTRYPYKIFVQNLQMFYTLWHFIRRLFWPMESISCLSPISSHFIHPSDFFGNLCSANSRTRKQRLVTHIRWYEESGSAEHEFLVAHLSNRYLLLIDRGPHPDASTSRIISTSPQSSSQVPAVDSLLVIDHTKRKTTLVERDAELMGSFVLQDCIILEFPGLLDTVCTSAPNYTIDEKMCYWSTSTIVTISKSLFHGEGKICSSRAEKCAGMRLYTDDPKVTAEITKKILGCARGESRVPCSYIE